MCIHGCTDSKPNLNTGKLSQAQSINTFTNSFSLFWPIVYLKYSPSPDFQSRSPYLTRYCNGVLKRWGEGSIQKFMFTSVNSLMNPPIHIDTLKSFSVIQILFKLLWGILVNKTATIHVLVKITFFYKRYTGKNFLKSCILDIIKKIKAGHTR